MSGRVIRVGAVALALGATGCSTPAGTEPAGHSTAGASWSTATRIQPTPTPEEVSLYGISCPTDSFCVAVDENGAAHLWQGGSWSKAQPVPAGGTLDSVSCPTVRHCVTVSGGNSSTFDGRSWSEGQAVGPSATYEISCPTADFCAAVGASGTPGGPKTVATFDGRSWSTTVLPARSSGAVSDRLFDVSCPTISFCIAVDLDGSALTYDGRAWSPNRGPAMRDTTSVSCPTTTFCMAVGQGGYSTFDGKAWSAPKRVPQFQSALFPEVSCAAANSCTVIGLNGESSQWRDGSWSTPVSVFTGEFLGTVAISCATPSFCMAVSSRGTAAHT
jgi:hypothetical protein